MAGKVSVSKQMTELYPVPAGYDRIPVTKMPTDQLRTIAQTAKTFERAVIIQDLLVAGRSQDASTWQFASLAAELYITSPEDLRKEFLERLEGSPLSCTFANAITANHIFHEEHPGSSRLTSDELGREKALVEALLPKHH